MDNLVLIHLVAVSFWLGVVSVEVIFERARIDRSAKVLLHQLTDRYVELPTISVVLVSGLVLWARASWSVELLPKVLFGLLAVGANVVCYYFVEKRTTEDSVFRKQSARIFWITIPGIISFFVAAYLGGSYAAIW